jgi:hypothetical protein
VFRTEADFELYCNDIKTITDAGRLVGFLTSESDQRSAVGKYDEEMKARAGERLRTSVMHTTMLHDCGKVMTTAALMTAGQESDRIVL